VAHVQGDVVMAVYLRARDVRDYVRQYGVEQGLVNALCKLCDENAGYRQSLVEMAKMLHQCIDGLDKMTTVGDHMRAKLNELERHREQYNITIDSELPPSDGG
jgi:hypothetical protein